MMKEIVYKSLLMIVIGLVSANVRSFEFKYEVTLEPTNEEKVELWIPIPKSNEVQEISNLRFDTDNLEYEIKKEMVHGNLYFYIHDENGIEQPTIISMIFNVNRKKHANQLYEGINPDDYLGAYSSVPTGNIFIPIITQHNLSQNNIRGIYNFVLSEMHYGKPKNTNDQYYNDPWLNDRDLYGMKGVTRDRVIELYQISERTNGDYTFGNGNSIYACDIGVGNCTDYHSYFMSLGRTLEIPVRFHMGFSIPLYKEGLVKGYHCWADYYVENDGWYPVDISEADKNPAKEDYFFGNLDNNRVDMMIGRDFILEGYDNGKLNLFIYPVLEINDTISSGFTKNFSYKNLN